MLSRLAVLGMIAGRSEILTKNPAERDRSAAYAFLNGAVRIALEA
jgi:hypothetical protein